MMVTIAFWCARASFNSACTRRAKVRSATTVLVVSVSQDECTRRCAAVLSIAASFWPRNRARMGSGAAITRGEDLQLGVGGGVDRGAAGGQQH